MLQLIRGQSDITTLSSTATGKSGLQAEQENQFCLINNSTFHLSGLDDKYDVGRQLGGGRTQLASYCLIFQEVFYHGRRAQVSLSNAKLMQIDHNSFENKGTIQIRLCSLDGIAKTKTPDHPQISFVQELLESFFEELMELLFEAEAAAMISASEAKFEEAETEQ